MTESSSPPTSGPNPGNSHSKHSRFEAITAPLVKIGPWLVLLGVLVTVYSCGDDYIDSRAAVRGRFIEAALTILREAPPDERADKEQKALKNWARDIINRHSSVELSDEAVRGFSRPPLTSGAEAIRVEPGAETYPLIEGSPLSVPKFGIEEMSVTFEEKEGQQLARVSVRLKDQDPATLTVTQQSTSGARFQLADSPHVLAVDKFYPEIPILLLRIGRARPEGEEEEPQAPN